MAIKRTKNGPKLGEETPFPMNRVVEGPSRRPEPVARTMPIADKNTRGINMKGDLVRTVDKAVTPAPSSVNVTPSSPSVAVTPEPGVSPPMPTPSTSVPKQAPSTSRTKMPARKPAPPAPKMVTRKKSK